MAEHPEAAELGELAALALSQLDALDRVLGQEEAEILAFTIAALGNGANQVVQPVLTPDANLAVAHERLKRLMDDWASDDEDALSDADTEGNTDENSEEFQFIDDEYELASLLEREEPPALRVESDMQDDLQDRGDDHVDDYAHQADSSLSTELELGLKSDIEESETLHPLLKDDHLKSIFGGEFAAHIDQLDDGLNRLDAVAVDSAECAEVVRDIDQCVHTLAGNCRNLGFDVIADCVEGDIALLHAKSSDNFFRAAVGHFSSGLKLLRSAHGQINQDGRLGPELVVEFTRHEELCQALKSAAEALVIDQEESAGDLLLQDEPAEDESVEDGLVEDGLVEDGPESRSEEELVETARERSIRPVEPEPVQQQEPEEGADVAIEKGEPAGTGEDIDDEIRQIFLEEAQGILGRVNQHLIDWKENTLSPKLLRGIKREFHTLKGSAAATGYFEISQLSHTLESLLDGYAMDDDMDHSGILNLLEEMHDGLAADLGFMSTGTEGHVATLNKMLEGLLPGESRSGEEEEKTG